MYANLVLSQRRRENRDLVRLPAASLVLTRTLILLLCNRLRVGAFDVLLLWIRIAAIDLWGELSGVDWLTIKSSSVSSKSCFSLSCTCSHCSTPAMNI